jgi:hypothetical protein
MSTRLVNGLIHGQDALPQYAGTRQRVVAAVLHNDAGEAVRIDRTDGSIWTFDEEGQISAGLRESMAEFMELIHDEVSTTGTVVSLQPKLRKKRIAERYRWEPTKTDIERVIKDIWPKARGDRLKEAKGVSKRKPPLTYDAKEAIGKSSENFWKIRYEIDSLKEPSLKGFIYEARDRSEDDPDFQHLYDALAKMGEQRLELLRRRNRGGGVWYALVEVMRASHEGNSFETVHVIHKKCKGRKAAVIAARRLLTENVHLFDDYINLETSVITDLEWKAHHQYVKDDDGD